VESQQSKQFYNLFCYYFKIIILHAHVGSGGQSHNTTTTVLSISHLLGSASHMLSCPSYFCIQFCDLFFSLSLYIYIFKQHPCSQYPVKKCIKIWSLELKLGSNSYSMYNQHELFIYLDLIIKNREVPIKRYFK
jgi:hypothetical protein